MNITASEMVMTGPGSSRSNTATIGKLDFSKINANNVDSPKKVNVYYVRKWNMKEEVEEEDENVEQTF